MTATIAPLPVNNGPNPYMDIFSNYINCTLEDSLAKVKAVKTALPDEDRIQACHVLDYGLKQTDAWTTARELTQELSTYIERSGDWEVGNQTMLDAIEAAQKAGDVDGEITQRALYARLLQRQGRTKETIQQYRRVIRMSRKSGNRFEEARACSNLGFLFVNDKEFVMRAEVLCRHALRIFLEIDNLHGISHTYNHLGIVSRRQQEWESAIQFFQQAYETGQLLDDNGCLIFASLNLGIVYLDMQKYPEALNCFEDALEYAQKLNDKVQLGRVLNNIGQVNLNLGKLNDAETALRKAENIFSQLRIELEEAKVIHNLGAVFMLQGKWDCAGDYLERALHSYIQLNNRDGEIKALFDLLDYDIASQQILKASKRLNYMNLLIKDNYAMRQLQSYHERLSHYTKRLAEESPSSASL